MALAIRSATEKWNLILTDVAKSNIRSNLFTWRTPMEEVLTHQKWKSEKKRLALTEPKAKQDVGKTLDLYHKDPTLRGSLDALKKLKAGWKAYLEANDGNKDAEKYLKDQIKNTDEWTVELKKRGLESEGMKDTLKAINDKIERLTLEEVWKDPTLKEFLREQLKKEHSLENIDFLEAVEKRKGAWIYEQWVAPKCAQVQVNLSSETFKDLGEQYQSDPGKMTYRDAFLEIFSLVRKDSFRRMKKESWDLKQEIGERMKLL